MRNGIPLKVKKTCCELASQGKSNREIYDEYFAPQFVNPQTFRSFGESIRHWKKITFPDNLTLEAGTYEGFAAHGATVQVSKDGEIVQAWIKQNANAVDPEEFIKAIQGKVEKYPYTGPHFNAASRMLEIPLFDMHWGIAFMDHYQPVLDDVLYWINSRMWDQIVIPFGQDFFHNDSIVDGKTTKGTPIEKVDMIRAVKEGLRFMYTIIEEALANSNQVKVLYTPGNHDASTSWMFMQTLLERYGPDVVDDSMEYRRVISYGKNAIMVTHGDSKAGTAQNLAHIFPTSFSVEFANANVREVHCGHLHHERAADIYGVMVRRLSSGGKVDEWTNRQDFIGSHRRFMLFEWDLEELRSIHYV